MRLLIRDSVLLTNVGTFYSLSLSYIKFINYYNNKPRKRFLESNSKSILSKSINKMLECRT